MEKQAILNESDFDNIDDSSRVGLVGLDSNKSSK